MSEIIFFSETRKIPMFLKENIDIQYMKYAKLHFFDSFQVKKFNSQRKY